MPPNFPLLRIGYIEWYRTLKPKKRQSNCWLQGASPSKELVWSHLVIRTECTRTLLYVSSTSLCNAVLRSHTSSQHLQHTVLQRHSSELSWRRSTLTGALHVQYFCLRNIPKKDAGADAKHKGTFVYMDILANEPKIEEQTAVKKKL